MADKLFVFTIFIIAILNECGTKAQAVQQNTIGIDCNREPTHSEAAKLVGDNGFRLRVHGHPTAYKPGEIYRVSLSSTLPTSFIGFMLSAVDADDNSLSVGSYELLDSRGSMFAPYCNHAVTHTSNVMRARIGFRWTAPSGNTPPCVLFRAVVIQRRGVWYSDDGELSLQICPEDLSVAPTTSTPLDAECCATGSAKYHMMFVGKWSRLSHPKDYPPDYLNHWSPLVGASHSNDYVLWEYGGYATEGVKQVAEWGAAAAMEREIKAQVQSGNVRTAFRTKGLWPARGNMTITFSTDARHPLVSALTMIGPSPDWNIGISNENMCMQDCTWLDHAEFDLLPWDAGTDNGVSYMSVNSPSDPRERIRAITSTDSPQSPFYDVAGGLINPLAKLYISRICKRGEHCFTSNTNIHDSSADMMKKPLGRNPTMPPKMIKTMPPKKIMPPAGITMPPKKIMPPAEITMPPKKMMPGGEGIMPPKIMPEVVTMPPKNIPPPKQMEEKVIFHTEDVLVIDCMLSDWLPWTECSKTCNKGKMSRTRMVKVEPRNGGLKCGKRKEKKSCNEGECTRDCKMGKWSRWSDCTSTCGEGAMRIRTRRVIREQTGNGEPCGEVMGEEMCKLDPCP